MRKVLSGFLIAFVFAVFFVPSAFASSIVTQINGSANLPVVNQNSPWNLESMEFAVPIGIAAKVTSVEIDLSASSILSNIGGNPIKEDNITQTRLPTAEHNYYTVYFDSASTTVKGTASLGDQDIIVTLKFDSITTTPETTKFKVKVEEPLPEPTPIPPAPPIPEPTPEPTPEAFSIPKVIISGFSTDPAQVVAGEEFVLYLTYKNTSTTGSISNFKISLTSDGTFNAVSGSLTNFITKLEAGASQTTAISLMPKADTAPGSYNVNLSLNYDADGSGNNTPVTDTEVIAIPVEQIPEAKLQPLEIVPEAPFVGQDFNVMCSVNNTGKSKLYNVTATVSCDGFIEPQEVYLGNIESGATGTVDLYSNPLREGNAVIALDIVYEDEKGKEFSLSETSEVFISTYMPTDVMPDIMPPEETGGSAVGWIVAIIFLIIAGGVAAFIIIRRKKKKLAAARDREIARQIEQQMIYQNNGYN